MVFCCFANIGDQGYLWSAGCLQNNPEAIKVSGSKKKFGRPTALCSLWTIARVHMLCTWKRGPRSLPRAPIKRRSKAFRGLGILRTTPWLPCWKVWIWPIKPDKHVENLTFALPYPWAHMALRWLTARNTQVIANAHLKLVSLPLLNKPLRWL
jgi:hypothetical protein